MVVGTQQELQNKRSLKSFNTLQKDAVDVPVKPTGKAKAKAKSKAGRAAKAKGKARAARNKEEKGKSPVEAKLQCKLCVSFDAQSWYHVYHFCSKSCLLLQVSENF